MKFKHLLQIILIIFSFFFLNKKVVAIETIPAEVTFSVSVENSISSASSVLIDGGSAELEMSEGETNDVIITADITDNNGCEDIESVTFVFYRTDVSGGYQCDLNNANCYTGSGSVVGSGNTCNSVEAADPEAEVDLSAMYVATIPIMYYADATDFGEYADSDWSAVAIPYDGDGAGTFSEAGTIEVATLLAISTNSPISFGTVSLGESSDASADYDTTITNTGNKNSLGIQVKSIEETAMVCETGNIPLENLRYDDLYTTEFSSKTSITTAYIAVEGVSVPKGESENTDTIGWGVLLPESGVSGTCSGDVSFTPI